MNFKTDQFSYTNFLFWLYTKKMSLLNHSIYLRTFGPNNVNQITVQYMHCMDTDIIVIVSWLIVIKFVINYTKYSCIPLNNIPLIFYMWSSPLKNDDILYNNTRIKGIQYSTPGEPGFYSTYMGLQ